MKRLFDSDHAALILAHRLHARSPNAEDFQILDVHDSCEDNGGNRGHISDLSASQAESGDTETVPPLSTDSAPPPTEGQQTSTATPASKRNVHHSSLIEPQSQEVAEVIQTEEQQREGITEAEGTMAYKDLRGDGSKDIWKVRDNTTNKNLAKVVVGRAAALMRRLSSLTATRSSTTPSTQVAM